MRIRIPRSVGRVGGPALVRALASTWRIETVHEEPWRRLHEARMPFVFMCWHEVLLPLVWRHRNQGITLVVSEARDGGYLADLGDALGYRLVRGSSTRGATRALLGAVRELREGHSVAFTPDGPRGPRRELKPGVAAAAQRSGAPILAIHATADQAWRFRSWDRFMLPKPFARIRVGYAGPITVGPGDEGLAAGLHAAAEAMAMLERITA